MDHLAPCLASATLRPTLLLFLTGLILTGGATHADEVSDSIPGDLTADIRLRTEQVRVPGFDDTSASTLRARLGWRSSEWHGFALHVEGEHIEILGGEAFNSTTNSRTRFATVADPEATEFNQAYVGWRRGDIALQVGRMTLELDNERFIGDVGFRQNQQTYDAAMLNYSKNGHRLRYMYMDKVHRVLGDDHPLGEFDMDTHVLHYRFARLNGDELSAYVHFIEMQDRDLVARSHRNVGLRYRGAVGSGDWRFVYEAELADQSDYAEGANAIDAYYVQLEAGIRFPNAWVANLGFARLGGDGSYGFQTPLATLHAFQGYADVFAGPTPAGGVDDRYARMRLPLGAASLEATFHDFQADDGGEDLGSEVDLALVYDFGERWQLGFKYADYDADGFGRDTRRIWAWVGFKL